MTVLQAEQQLFPPELDEVRLLAALLTAIIDI
jgi:hypothetical protein